MLKKFFVAFAVMFFLFSATSPTFAEKNEEFITVTGTGYGPKGANPNGSFYRSFARQAAKFDALRQLAENVDGVQVVAETSAEKGNIIYDRITFLIDEEISALLEKNAKQVGEAKFFTADDGKIYCEVTMKCPKSVTKSITKK